MTHVLPLGRFEYHNIIEVNAKERQVRTYLVHHTLDRGRGIHDYERNYFKLVSSKATEKSGILLPIFDEPYLPVSNH